MIKIEDKKKCSGCSACKQICPVNAITMNKDEKGFLYPLIDEKKCINCNLCENICPIINQKEKPSLQKAYIAYQKNQDIRLQSSSGGIFSLLAEKIIEQNGVVFGAKFDDDFGVIHSYVEKKQDIEKLRGSKYVQSIIGNTYQEAKRFLEDGRKVLFTGTPCQIEGLLAFLRKDYDNLYTQDIICHGVPSPKIWRKYLTYKNRNKDEIKYVSFRNKDNGWQNYNLKLVIGSKAYKNNHIDDLFMRTFLQNISLRESCYECSFKKKERLSDITLADAWGCRKYAPEFYDKKGSSVIIIHSKKGEKLINDVLDKTLYKEVAIDQVISYNESMIKSAKMNSHRENFFAELDKQDFEKLVNAYTTKRTIKDKAIYNIKNVIKSVLRK